MPSRLPRVISLALVLIAAPAHRAFASCDVSANSSALADARTAIDAACPCANAAKPSDHVKCAKPVVADRVAHGLLDPSCKGTALKHATRSICGRPGAVVCCRVKTNGKTAHKVAKDAALCASTPTITACVSSYEAVDFGCDATGCVPPAVCGNGVLEPGETCEPPYAPICDDSCHTATCDPPVTSCGNGVLDAGEACEPPGVGGCGWDCQLASCAGGGPNEIDVACASDGATVGVGARAGEYLAAWNDLAHRPDPDIVARRLDADGAAIDAEASVVSAGVPCAGQESSPSVGSNAAGYVLGWYGLGPAPGSTGFPYYEAAYARPFGATATLGHLDELDRRTPFGQCQTHLGGPTAVAPVPRAGSATFAALWLETAACLGTPVYYDPAGGLVDYAPSPPASTTLAIGYELGSLPRALSDGAANLATLGNDTLAVWHAHIQNTSPPYVSGEFVAGAWLAADGTTTSFAVSSRQPGIGNALRPAVAAGSAAFLVVWADGPVGAATDVRAMRVAPNGVALDPAGGRLLATAASGGVVRGPVVAFDGAVWLVAWTEAGVGGNDLRAVAVAIDGSVLDASPRLLASGLSGAEPAIASAADGRSLIVYVRPDGGKSAVRAQVVAGQ